MPEGEWQLAGAILDAAPAILPESRALLAEWVAALEFGRADDALSALAWHAWRQRWWRAEEGRGRRAFHYLRAAVAQARAAAQHDWSQDFAAMPLGAVRGLCRAGDRSWEPGEPKADGWLATLPLFEALGERLIAVDCLTWPPAQPEKWHSRTLALDALGNAAALALMGDLKPVRVYRTPRRWNRAGGPGAPGCVILDWDGELGRLLLGGGAPVLVGDDRDHARDLKRRIDKARPRIKFVLARRGTQADV